MSDESESLDSGESQADTSQSGEVSSDGEIPFAELAEDESIDVQEHSELTPGSDEAAEASLGEPDTDLADQNALLRPQEESSDEPALDRGEGLSGIELVEGEEGALPVELDSETSVKQPAPSPDNRPELEGFFSTNPAQEPPDGDVEAFLETPKEQIVDVVAPDDDFNGPTQGAFPDDFDIGELLTRSDSETASESSGIFGADDEETFSLGGALSEGSLDLPEGMEDVDWDQSEDIVFGEGSVDLDSPIGEGVETIGDMGLDELPEIGISMATDEGALPLEINIEELSPKKNPDEDLELGFIEERAEDDLWGNTLESRWEPGQNTEALGNSVSVPVESALTPPEKPMRGAELPEEPLDETGEGFSEATSVSDRDLYFEEATGVLRRLSKARREKLDAIAESSNAEISELSEFAGRRVSTVEYTVRQLPAVSDAAKDELGAFSFIPLADVVPYGIELGGAAEASGSQELLSDSLPDLLGTTDIELFVDEDDVLRDEDEAGQVFGLFATTSLSEIRYKELEKDSSWVNISHSEIEGAIREWQTKLTSEPLATFVNSLLSLEQRAPKEESWSNKFLGLFALAILRRPDMSLHYFGEDVSQGELSFNRLMGDVARSLSTAGFEELRDDNPIVNSEPLTWLSCFHVSMRIVEAMREIRRFNWEQAEEHLRFALQSEPSLPIETFLRFGLARLSFELGQYSDVGDDLTQAVKGVLSLGWSRFPLEYFAYSIKDLDLAKTLLEGAPLQDLTHSERFRLARNYEHLKEPQNSWRLYDVVRQALPHDYLIDASLVRLGIEQGAFEDVRIRLLRLASSFEAPVMSATLYFEAGTIAQRVLGDVQLAIDDFSNALQRLPTFTPALQRLSRLWSAQGQTAYIRQHLADEIEAIESSLRPGERDPDAEDGLLVRYFRLARMAEAAGEIEHAMVLHKRALGLVPSCEWALSELERLFYRNGRWVDLAALLLGWANEDKRRDDSRQRLIERTAEVFLFLLDDLSNTKRLIARALRVGGANASLRVLADLSLCVYDDIELLSELVESPERHGGHVDPFVQLRDGRLSGGSDLDSYLSTSLDTAPEFVNLATLFIASREHLGQMFEAEGMAKLIQLNSPLAIRFAVEVHIERQRHEDALSLLENWSALHPYNLLTDRALATSLTIVHGRLLYDLGSWDQAAKFWAKYAEGCFPETAVKLLTLSGRIFEQKCFDLESAASCIQALRNHEVELGLDVAGELDRLRGNSDSLEVNVPLEDLEETLKKEPPYEDSVDWIAAFDRLLMSSPIDAEVVNFLKLWLESTDSTPVAQWVAVEFFRTHEDVNAVEILPLLIDEAARSELLFITRGGDLDRLREAVSLNAFHTGALSSLLTQLLEAGLTIELRERIENALLLAESPEQIDVPFRFAVKYFVDEVSELDFFLDLFFDHQLWSNLAESQLELVLNLALQENRADCLRAVVSELDNRGGTVSSLMSNKAKLHVLLASGRESEAMEVIEEILKNDEPDVETYELIATLLGRRHQWDLAVAVLEKGFSSIRVPKGRTRLGVLLGEIYARVKDEPLNAAGWYLRSGLADRFDLSLIGSFVDTVRAMPNEDRSDARLKQGFQVCASAIDGLFEDEPLRESLLSLSADVLSEAGYELRAAAFRDALGWFRGQDGALSVAPSTDDGVVFEPLSESDRVAFIESGIERTDLWLLLNEIGPMVAEVVGDVPGSALGRLSRRSFTKTQSYVDKLCRGLRLEGLQLWNGGLNWDEPQLRFFPQPALVLSRELLEREWSPRELFSVGHTLEAARYFRGVIADFEADSLMQLLIYAAKVAGGAVGASPPADADLALYQRMARKIQRLPNRLRSQIQSYERSGPTVEQLRAVQFGFTQISDRVGLLVSDSLPAALSQLIAVDDAELSQLRRNGKLMSRVAENRRALALLEYATSQEFLDTKARWRR